jgi:hypothetical protein
MSLLRHIGLVLAAIAFMRVTAAEPISEAMRHGQKQVQRMLDDRPGMALYRAEGSPVTQYITESDAPWQWAQRAFAGVYVNERVFWDHRLPPNERRSDSTSPYHNALYSITLRPPARIDPEHFEHTWARLVYEMHRMSRDTQRSRIATLVQYRWVPVDTAVQEYARIYWSVRKELELFYHQTWRPWAESRSLPVHPRLWMLDHTGTFDSWYEENPDRFDYMRKYYQDLLKPTRK